MAAAVAAAAPGSQLASAAPLVERDRPGDGDVQRLGDSASGIDATARSLDHLVAAAPRARPRARTSSSPPARRSASGVPRARRARPLPGRLVEAAERHAEDRPRRRAQRLRRGRVGAAVGERDRRAERVRGPDQRADVSGSATCQSASPTGRGRRRADRARRKTPITRGGCASVDTPASSSGSTSSPGDEQVVAARFRPRAPRRRDPRPRRRRARVLARCAGSRACGSASGAGSRRR